MPTFPASALRLFVPLALLAASANAQPNLPGTVPTDTSQRYAWSGNTGWVDFAAGNTSRFRFEDYFLSGFAWSPNFGWIVFGDGIPSNGVRYSNRSSSDCGVNHDGLGNLSGYAYGANIGWISFEWASALHRDRPRVNLQTGEFSGYAYGANIGWINLEGLRTATMGIRDSDADGISDPWENEFLRSVNLATAAGNLDGDARSDREEFVADSNPGSSQSVFGSLSVTYEPGLTGATVTFQTSSRRFYRLEIADSLESSAWADSGLGLITPSSGHSTTRSITWTGATRKFIRAVAVLPLSAP